jgi:hypothetical protein
MANPTTPQQNTEKNAQKYFKKAGAQDETLAKQTRKKELAAAAAKTAKLRDLRLAKERADKEASDKLAAEQPGTAAEAKPRKRATPAKAPTMVRMTY